MKKKHTGNDSERKHRGKVDAAVFGEITKKKPPSTSEITAMKEIQKREDMRCIIYTDSQCWPSRSTKKNIQY